MCRTVCAALRIAVRMASSTLVWLLPTISLSRYTWSDTAASRGSAPGAVVSPPAERYANGGPPTPPRDGLYRVLTRIWSRAGRPPRSVKEASPPLAHPRQDDDDGSSPRGRWPPHPRSRAGVPAAQPCRRSAVGADAGTVLDHPELGGRRAPRRPGRL